MTLYYSDNGIFESVSASGSNYQTIPPKRTVSTHQHNLALTAAEVAAGTLFFDAIASFNLTGIVPPSPSQGYKLLILNTGNSDVHIKQGDGNSAAANRFETKDNQTVSRGEFIDAMYVDGAWRLFIKD